MKRLIFNLNNHQYTTRIDVEPNGAVSFVGGGKHHGWLSMTGIEISTTSAGENVLPLQNNWIAYGGVYAPATYKVEDGVCHVAGLIKNGKWGNIGQLPGACRPSKRLIFNLNNHAAVTRVDVTASGLIAYVGGAKSHGWLSLTGIAFTVGAAGQKTLQLTNNWKPYGHVYGTPTYKSTAGECVVEGLVKGSNWGRIALLPSDCRPMKRLIFNLNNNDKTSRVDVLKDGAINWVAGGKGHGWLSLSGIAFMATR